jgi:hypothetical protein
MLLAGAGLLALGGLSSSCGGGGSSSGGPGEVAPILISAVVSDATPSSGDTLTLSFSADITLATGVLLNDSDVSLSGSGSLGTVALGPVRLTARSVQVTLGAGVSLNPGTTTIALANGQDAVLDGSGNALTDTTTVTVGSSDGERPSISLFTANDVPGVLSGAGAQGGTLLLPRQLFTIAANYSDVSSSVDPSKTVLTADAVVRADGQDRGIGTNLAGLLTSSSSTTSATWTVGSNDLFPVATVTLTLTVTDTSGNVSVPETLVVRVAEATNALRPFENGQTWYIDLTRDVDSYSQSGTLLSIVAPSTPNSTADFLEELIILGLRSATPISNVSGSKDSNEVVLDLFKAELLEQLGLLYSGSGVAFTFGLPGTFPNGQYTVAYEALGFSIMAVGSNPVPKSASSGTTPGTSPLGLAIYDENNTTQDNNSLEDASSRLGVFPMALIQASINGPGSAAFRVVFDPFIKNRGTPIGEDGGDAARLQNILAQGSVSDGRDGAIRTAIDYYARFLAVVIAHECGHSVGLVANDAQPKGLFGGIGAFGGSSGHIDLSGTSVFPAGAQEVMKAAISFTEAQSASTAFNPLIQSYLAMSGMYDTSLPAGAVLGGGRCGLPSLLGATNGGVANGGAATSGAASGRGPATAANATARVSDPWRGSQENPLHPVRYDLAWQEATDVVLARVVRRGLRQELRVLETLRGEARNKIRLYSLDGTGAHERVFVSAEPWLVFLRESPAGAVLLQHDAVQTRVRSDAHWARLRQTLTALEGLRIASEGARPSKRDVTPKTGATNPGPSGGQSSERSLVTPDRFAPPAQELRAATHEALALAFALRGVEPAAASALFAAIAARPAARAAVLPLEGEALAQLSADARLAPAIRETALHLASESAPLAAMQVLPAILRGEDAPRYARSAAGVVLRGMPGQAAAWWSAMLADPNMNREAAVIALDATPGVEAWRSVELLRAQRQFAGELRQLRRR